MLNRIVLALFILVFLLALVSCSGNEGTPTAPAPVNRDMVSSSSSQTLVLGLWQVAVNADGSYDIATLREADKILNVLGFMEPPALSLMGIENLVVDFEGGIINVDVSLRHPIAGDTAFNGFDVRGVCFGPEVTNGDGATIIPSPEFFSGVPFGYMDGLLGAPDSFANYEGVAGYKYFADNLGTDDDLVAFFTDPDNLAQKGVIRERRSEQEALHARLEQRGA